SILEQSSVVHRRINSRATAALEMAFPLSRIILSPLLILIAILTPAMTAQAQSPGSFDVFYSANVVKGKSGVFFVDARTGLSSSVVTNGVEHSVLSNGVLFQESDTRLMKIAYPDGRVELFTPMQPSGPNLRIEWVVSENREWL